MNVVVREMFEQTIETCLCSNHVVFRLIMRLKLSQVRLNTMVPASINDPVVRFITSYHSFDFNKAMYVKSYLLHATSVTHVCFIMDKPMAMAVIA
jgi:hypothetical protein